MTDQYHCPDRHFAHSQTQNFAAAVDHDKHSDQSQHTVSLAAHVRHNMARQYQIIGGARLTFLMK